MVIIILMLLLPLFLACYAHAQAKNDTAHYDVVAEYIRSLGAIHRIQQTASKELEEGDKDNPIKKLMDGIRSSTRINLELNSSIYALKRMTLKKPFDELIPNTISSYQAKIELHKQVIEISEKFIDGATRPKQGVDYSKLAATMPKITATIEYIDESIFQSMVLVFALLIDDKPDSEGHMSHLSITKAQRQKLIDNINDIFGESLDKKNQNWTVSSAALLKTYLLKDDS